MQIKTVNEQYRFLKLLSNQITQNQIEKEILLKLYPNICLKPSIEVMQVFNYVNYAKSKYCTFTI